MHPLVPQTRAAPRPRRQAPIRGSGWLPHPQPSRGRPGRRAHPPQSRRHLDPAKLTVDQYLDRWLAHIQTSLHARTVARYAALLRDHLRPDIGARPLKQLPPLEVQAIYDRLAVGGRRDGKPGSPHQHILAVHRCLHRALGQAVTWRLLARNVATDATPPPVPSTEVVTLTAAGRAALGRRRPHPHPVVWHLDDPRRGERRPQRRTLRPGMGRPRPGRRHGPVPPGAHHHRPGRPSRRRPRLKRPTQGTGRRAAEVHRQRRDPHPAAVRRAGATPAPPPAGPVAPRQRAAPDGHASKGRTGPAYAAELDLVFRTERGTAVNPNHANRAFASLAARVGLAAHPHLLRHALASAMAANKSRPASSPPSCAMPTAADLTSGSTSTSFPRPPPSWPG
jgi:hypothetical protein